LVIVAVHHATQQFALLDLTLKTLLGDVYFTASVVRLSLCLLRMVADWPVTDRSGRLCQ
jgi:hypothetical protein